MKVTRTGVGIKVLKEVNTIFVSDGGDGTCPKGDKP